MMFAGEKSNFWDERYSQNEYVYGTSPNAFLAQQKSRLPQAGKALAIGDGEGRNGVWLAEQGLDVLSVDISAAGLEKTQQLATQRQVSIHTQQLDLSTWQWPKAEYDAVVAIYVHFHPDIRQRMHQAALNALKPNGLLILEAFNPAQLSFNQKYGSGGPRSVELLYTPSILQQDFADGKILMIEESIINLDEGAYHRGQASVIRLVVQKKV